MSGDLMIDGVRIFRHPGDQTRTDATLTFGVGARDETLRTVGVSHMIEHLAMGHARHTPIDIQAEVDLETTDFHASGSPGRVAEFLRTICETLADPPIDRLAIEAGVLAAEDGSVASPITAMLLNCRYGAGGPGLAWLVGPGYDGLTATHIRSFARTWFTASNALLQIAGPLPVVCVHEEAAEELTKAGFEVTPLCPVVARLPGGRSFKPPFTARVLVKEARGAVLVLTDDGVAARDVDGSHYCGGGSTPVWFSTDRGTTGMTTDLSVGGRWRAIGPGRVAAGRGRRASTTPSWMPARVARDLPRPGL